MSREVDFSYYEPKNQNQREFHDSTAINKLLIGPYRSGKTYPAIHEALFICRDNPGHEFAIFRNTDKSLKKNIQKDFLNVAFDSGAAQKKDWIKSEGVLTLWNGCRVIFELLSVGIENLKGMNVCGFLIDDPDVTKYWDVISFLYSRLTDPPRGNVKAAYFSTIICANYEGHDKLWQTYMRRKKPGGNKMFAYWFCKTQDNPTLDKNYIAIQKATHSEAWMKRYIHGDLKGYVGLVYSEYESEFHDADLEWCFNDHTLLKVLAIDCGITHPTVVLQVATDNHNIYVYNEWYRVNIRTADLGDYLLKKLDSEESYKKLIIDPKSHAREQTSGTSPRLVLEDECGIKGIEIAKNAVKPGIEIMKGIMTVREDDSGPEKKMKTHFYVDPKRCPKLIRELEVLKWKEPESSDFDELAYKEEPVDKDNDGTDCARYACVYLRKYLTGMKRFQKSGLEKQLEKLNNRLNNLKHYSDHPNPGAVRANLLRKIQAARRIENESRVAEMEKEVLN